MLVLPATGIEKKFCQNGLFKSVQVGLSHEAPPPPPPVPKSPSPRGGKVMLPPLGGSIVKLPPLKEPPLEPKKFAIALKNSDHENA